MNLKFRVHPEGVLLHGRPFRERVSLIATLSRAVAGLLLPGCIVVQSDSSITGSGHLVTTTLDHTGFTGVAAGSAFHVTITRAEQWSVAITVDDNLADYVEVTQSKDKLRIGLKPNVGIRQATLKAAVTLPELTDLELGGASRATVGGFSSERSLEVEVSGASHLEGDVKSGDTRVEASGASHVKLQGQARNLKVKASGASQVNLEQYGSEDTVVTASGASHVVVSPRGKLEVEAAGASSVRYAGTPTSVNSHTSGASSVRAR